VPGAASPPALEVGRDLAHAVLGAFVVAQSQKGRVADPAVLGPLGESDLADELRLDPVVAAARGRAGVERGGRARERREPLGDERERRLVEPRADLRDVDEAAVRVEPEVERAEVCARALGRCVASDDELLAELALDFEPVPGTLADVGAVPLLRHDALEAGRARRVEELPALGEHVIAEVDDTARWQEELETRLALLQRQPAQVTSVERERVEEHRADGDLEGRALDVARTREVHPRLEALEARAPAVVERHDLAVEEEPVEGQRAERADHLRVARRDDHPAPSPELDALARAGGQDPHAVVLDLEEPRGIGERLIRERGEHEESGARRHVALWRLGGREPRAQGVKLARAVAKLLDGEPREDRLGERLDRLVAVREGVGLLQEEPLPLLAAHAREHPSPAELESKELELELAPRDLLARRPVAERAEPAAVPDDGRPRAVAALGDHALEVGILDWVVLDVDGQAALAVADRGALGHRPAREHAVDLEPQVVVEPPRRVLVDDEQVAVGRPAVAERLGRARGVALVPVLVEAAARHAAPGSPPATRTDYRPRAR